MDIPSLSGILQGDRSLSPFCSAQLQSKSMKNGVGRCMIPLVIVMHTCSIFYTSASLSRVLFDKRTCVASTYIKPIGQILLFCRVTKVGVLFFHVSKRSTKRRGFWGIMKQVHVKNGLDLIHFSNISDIFGMVNP